MKLRMPLLFCVQAFLAAPAASARPPSNRTEAPEASEKVETKQAVSTGIAWKITPGKVTVYLDDKKLGQAKDLATIETKPGVHLVRLVNGGDETEFEVRVSKGQILQVEYEFSD